MHWPFRQHESARNIRRSAIRDKLVQRGACFGEVAGWERPNWYAPKGMSPRYDYSYDRPNWFDVSADERHSVRRSDSWMPAPVRSYWSPGQMPRVSWSGSAPAISAPKARGAPACRAKRDWLTAHRKRCRKEIHWRQINGSRFAPDRTRRRVPRKLSIVRRKPAAIIVRNAR